MSDKEASDRSQVEDEVDNLFGDDAEDVKAKSPQPSNSNDSDTEDNSGGDDEDVEREAESRVSDIVLPRHAVSFKAEEDTYLIKMPIFLNVEAHPFDPNEFKENVAQNALERGRSTLDAKAIENDLTAEKLLNENMIRWRYSNSGNDEIIKQSNAHFIQWNDGLLSLKIGKELFDFREVPLVDNFLAKSYTEHEILQNDSILTKSASLLPSSTATDTHRKLTQAVKNIQKKDKILNTLTEDDPMLRQRTADENERKTLKMRRQLANKRRLQEERLGKSDSPAPGRSSQSSAYDRYERTYGEEEYDDEDNFVANDDEELDESVDEEGEEDEEDEEERFERGAERLKNLQKEGHSKYSSGSHDDMEERRKRRRVIDSDDEE